MVEVLDGKRLPTPAERANAILSHVRLGAHVHLLPRNGQDEDTDLALAAVEDGAHTLGLELVAPRERIFSLVYSMRKATTMVKDLCAGLAKHFGLPQHVFRRFVEQPEQRRIISFLEDIRPALEPDC